MDVLSDILNLVRLRGTLYFRTEFSAPWGVLVPAHNKVARFHLVSRGQCWLTVKGQDQPLALAAGDLVVIPHGLEHTLKDAPDSPVRSVDQVVEESGFTGRGALIYGGEDQNNATSLICGHFAFDEEVSHPLFESLPRYIHIRGSESLNYMWLENAMRFMGQEAGTGKPGSQAIVIKLTEIIFIQIVRAFTELAGAEQQVVAGINDPRIGPALAAIHSNPEQNWTLESLAREAGLSRTSFTERFQKLMGATPLTYLTQWRMQKARRILLEEQVALAEVAERSGYRSEAAFARVFKKFYDMGPASYRRQKAETPLH